MYITFKLFLLHFEREIGINVFQNERYFEFTLFLIKI